MADLKRWFKVWSTVVHDPHFQELPLEDIGRWVMIGALIVSSGAHGRLTSPPHARVLCALLRVPDADAAKQCISRLPHVRVEEGKTDNGDFTVIMDNWFKYQEDSTAYERLKRSRSKRRGEESRGDESPLPPLSAARQPTPEPDSFTRFWAAYPRHIGKPGTLKAWRALKPNNGLVEAILVGLTRWRAYWSAQQTPQDRVPYPGTWLRDRRWEDDPGPSAAASDPYAGYPRS